MANVSSPFGLWPIGINGAGDVRTNVCARYTIAESLNATLDMFSPVVLTGTGTNITAGAGTGEFLVGAFMGCSYIDTNGVPRFSRNWVASTATRSGLPITAFVADDPLTRFEIQGDNSAWAAADVGLNVDYAVGTRNAMANQSGAYAVRTGINTTATLMLRIVEHSRTVTNNEWGSYARLIVQINAHRWRSTTGA